MQDLLIKIIQLVEESDSSAVDLINEAIEQFTFGEFEKPILSAFKALEVLEFDEALIHLNKIPTNE